MTFVGVCAVGGCANGATHLVSIPCLIDGRAGELDGVPICDDHNIEALPSDYMVVGPVQRLLPDPTRLTP